MGNFSRDTYRLTNVLSQVIGGTSVTDPRAYVGVRVQQGVPLLDADLNELEDIRRGEHEALGWMWIGTGAPVGSDGFRIAKGTIANDFTINPGAFLIEGWFLHVPTARTYLTQPHMAGQPQTPPAPTLPALPPLAPPAAGAGTRHDLIFLDAWEHEATPDEDVRLQDPHIGMPTAVRLQREWVVRVEPGVSATAPAIPAAVRALYPGHRLTPLALLRRAEGATVIVPDDIADLRRTDLTLSAGESPLRVYASDGNLEYQSVDFAALHETAAKVYGDVLASDLFLNSNFNDINAGQAVTVLDAFGDVKAQCHGAAMLATARLVGSLRAWDLLDKLATAQKQFVERLKPMADAATRRVTTAQFLEQLLILVGEKTGQTSRGLRQALNDGALRDAIEAQMAINSFVGSRTGTLPTGRLAIEYIGGPPVDTLITAPGPFRYVYKVTSQVSGRETFDVGASVDGAPDWSVAIPATIELSTNEVATVNADVLIPLGSTSTGGKLIFRVSSRLNPGTIDFSNNDATVALNELPTPAVPLAIQLVSPAINVALDVLSVGILPPVNLPGHKVRAQYQVTNTSTSTTLEQFDVTFAFSVADVFEDAPPQTISVVGGAFTNVIAVFEAKAAATNGTRADVTMTVTNHDDAEITKTLLVMLKVQK